MARVQESAEEVLFLNVDERTECVTERHFVIERPLRNCVFANRLASIVNYRRRRSLQGAYTESSVGPLKWMAPEQVLCDDERLF
jgi:hypothetical protein